MKILIVSLDGIPQYSGAWTTNLDLLGRDHTLGFISARTIKDMIVENVRIYPPMEYSQNGITDAVTRVMKMDNYDFCLCLGDRESFACQELKVPYMTRYHTLPFDATLGLARKVKENAFWVIENHPILPKDLVDTVIPHAIDPERYTDCYNYHIKKRSPEFGIWFLLLTTLNWVENPLEFIQACKSAQVKGTIIGDGEMMYDVNTMCMTSRGYCQYKRAVTHELMPEVLKSFDVGVSTLAEKSPNKYILKSIEYAAAGLIVLQPTWAIKEVNSICRYSSTKELVEWLHQLDSCYDIYKERIIYNRECIEALYNARKWAEIFNKELKERFDARI